MTSRRPYRDAMSREAALVEIAGHSGTQFDPTVVQSFLIVVRQSPDGFYEEQDDDEFAARVEASWKQPEPLNGQKKPARHGAARWAPRSETSTLR
jgi:HD-GYP domain-containing protein (c-di-GMP phosphodiesterase class II)